MTLIGLFVCCSGGLFNRQLHGLRPSHAKRLRLLLQPISGWDCLLRIGILLGGNNACIALRTIATGIVGLDEVTHGKLNSHSLLSLYISNKPQCCSISNVFQTTKKRKKTTKHYYRNYISSCYICVTHSCTIERFKL